MGRAHAVAATLARAVIFGCAVAAVALRRHPEGSRRLLGLDPVTDHKVWSPMDSSDYFGLAAAIGGLMIAAGGGIGGGGMLVPIYVLVMGFKPKFAIPLSNMTVLGGAITNVSMNAFKRHPLADRAMVDWDLLVLMEPLTLAGALAGGFVNKLAPELLITVLLVILLYLTSERTLKKGFKLYAKESAQFSAASALAKAATEELADETESLLEEQPDEETKAEKNEMLETIEAEEKLAFPPRQSAILLGMFFLTVAINLAKGGGAFPSPLGIECGTFQYWAMTFIMFGSLLMISFGVRDYLIKRTKEKDACGYTYVEGDFHWDEATTLKYPAVCFFAGVCAGLFGIGGGIVNGPLMLELGVLPPVAGATTACMILLTSTTAATTFLTFGLVQLDYAKRLFAVGLAATCLGQLGMSHLIRKTGRQSYVAFSIGAVVSLSTVLMGFHGVVSLATGGSEGGGGGICDTGDR